jgi:hypothetical protein
MSAVAIEQSDVIKSMQAALSASAPVRAMPTGPAIENKPIVGAEVTIKLSLSPGMVTLIAAPVTVLATMLVGWVLLKSMGMPGYAAEMLGGAIATTIGGVAAAMPMFLLMKRGVSGIAQAALLGIALRIGATLMVMMLAGTAAWGLDRTILAYWVLGFYAPMFMVESAVNIWLSNKAAH